MNKSIIAVMSAAVMLGGCATASKDIAASYASPVQYQQHDCAQLTSETQRVQARITQLGGRLDKAAANDKLIAGVGAVLFWPALFALGGSEEQEAEYARLKGEYEAVQQAAVAKKCLGAVAQ